ncbi:glycosyltransferase [Burkholderia sp. WSM2230]|uniref:glycosyltransferase n=1 Tax=Burkholderia sp. WSM2230 TaxID=944435 RepID=UPI0009FD18AD|nr:glycosyltransferase [Burkholderia sp. WSM2230]
MKYSSSITLLMDGNFSRVGTEIYSPHMGYEQFAVRFTHSFDEVKIAARSFPTSKALGKRVTGAQTSFVDLGANRGAGALVFGIPRLLRRLHRVVRNADVLLIRFPGNIAMLAMLICKLTGKPFSAEVVADPADYFSDAASRHPLRRIARSVHCWATQHAVRRAKTVRYVTARSLQQHYPPLRMDRAFGFSDVYLPDAMFERSPSAAVGEQDGFRIVNVAMMHNESKGHDLLIRAIGRLRAGKLDVRLTLIGDGVLRERFERLAKEEGVADAVHFAGSMDGDEVRQRVAQHALFVLPSFQEGMPRAMLEAMALGVPVIATRVGGIGEVLDEQSLIAPGDIDAFCARIKQLATDTAFRRSEADRQRAIARNFQFSTLQEQYEVYCGELQAASRR